MGILHSRKNDWTETLYKAYTWNDVIDEKEIVGFELFGKPYQSKYDISKNSSFHIFDRNNFNDNNYFEDTTSTDKETYSDRI